MSHTITKIIVIIYTLNVLWYLFHGKPWNAGYWLCAAGITICATWGIGK